MRRNMSALGIMYVPLLSYILCVFMCLYGLVFVCSPLYLCASMNALCMACTLERFCT